MKLNLVPIDEEATASLLTQSFTTGFQSPADDYKEDPISIDQIVIKNKTATFFGTVEGQSMKEHGIFHGSHLVVDKSVKVQGIQLVVAA
jgi:DNA polymerase V